MRWNPFSRSKHLDAITAKLAVMDKKLDTLQTLGAKIMSAVDDGLATLSADISALSVDFSAGIAALQAAIAAGDPIATAAQATKLADMDTAIKAMDATAKGLVPPAAPAP